MLTTLRNIAFIFTLLIPFMDIPALFTYDTVRLPLLITFSSVILWCILAEIIKSGEMSSRKSPLSSAAILFLLCNILSIVKAVNIYEAVRAVLPITSYLLLYWFIVSGYLSRTLVIKYAVNVIVCVGLALSVYGIMQKLGIDFIDWGGGRGAINSITGLGELQPVSTLGNTNYAGGLLAILLPFTLALCFSKNGVPSTIFYLVTTVSIATHLIITGSRAGWLGAFAGTFVVIVLAIRFLVGSTKWRLVISAAILLSISFIGYISYQKIATIFDTSYSSNKVRLDVWSGAVRMWQSEPTLGVAPGNFQLRFQPYRSDEEFRISNGDLLKANMFNFVEDAHNSYVQIFSELGIVGFLVFLFLVYVALRRWWFFVGSFKSQLSTHNAQLPTLIALGGGVIGFLVAGFFNSLIIFIAHSTYFFVFLGFIELVGNSRPAIRKRPAGEKVLAISVCMFFVSIFLIYYTFQYMTAEYYSDKGRLLLSRGQYGKPHLLEEAKTTLEKSRDIDFYRWKMHYDLASTYKLLGKNEDARLEYEYMLNLNPNHPPALNNLANILAEGAVNPSDKRLQDAEALLKKAIDMAPSFPLSYRNLVGVYLKMGKQNEAMQTQVKEQELLKYFNPIK